MTKARLRRAVPGLVLLVLVGGCASGRTSSAGSPGPTGCYRFDDGEAASSLPWGMELEEAPLEEGWPLMRRLDDVRRARTLASSGQRRDHPFGYWRTTGSDSVEVGHPGGGGLTLTLHAAEDRLVGRGRSAGDAVPPGAEPEPDAGFSVRAERISCPEPSSPPAPDAGDVEE